MESQKKRGRKERADERKSHEMQPTDFSSVSEGHQLPNHKNEGFDVSDEESLRGLEGNSLLLSQGSNALPLQPVHHWAGGPRNLTSKAVASPG